MDDHRFDALVRAIGAGATRRRVLKMAGMAALAPLHLARNGGAAAAEKVTVCHKPGTAAERTLRVAAAALNGHLGHGDYINPDGCCPAGSVVLISEDGTGTCCFPSTCEVQGATCGEIPDQCGGILVCGDCELPETCGGAGVDNVCGCTADPVGITCADRCGETTNNCGHPVDCGACCTPDYGACSSNEECCSGACTCAGNPEGGICQGAFSQGFDVDASGWTGVVASGGVGIVGTGGSAFTRWGGYSPVFPAGGYTTSTDIFLDMAEAVETDRRFDYSSAINVVGCTHRRDFVFSAGTDPSIPGQWLISASNNAPGWPGNPARSPLTVAVSGWYTFSHTFYDLGSGQLACDLTVSGPGGSSTWTLTDPSDVIGVTVGGNRYGWFVTNAFPNLQIDNTSRV